MGTEELNQTSFDNGGDEELREDRGDFFEADEVPTEDKKPEPEEGGKKSDDDQAEPPAKEKDGNDPEPSEEKAASRAVPYERFNAVNEQKKLLEQQNEMLRQLIEQGGSKPAEPASQEAAPPAESKDDAVELRDLRRQLKDALYSDDESKYDEIQEKIDAINERRSRAAIRAELEASEAKRNAEREQAAVASAAQRMVEQFPVLHHETGDPEAIKKVVALRDYYMNAEGMPLSKALEKAATEIGTLYTGAAENPAAKPATDPRRAAAIERGVREANDTPPPTSHAGVGARAQAARLNPDKMSEREFKTLPEEERARLRGDIV